MTGDAAPRRRRRPALRTRAMVAFGALAFIVSSIIASVSYEVTRQTLVDQREQSAERQAYLNARAIRSALETGQGSPGEALAGIQTNAGGSALLRTGGDWFATSVKVGRDDVPRSLLSTVDDGDAGRQRVQLGDEPAVTVGVPILSSSAEYFEFVPMNDLARTLGTVRQGLILAALATTALGVLAGRATSSRVLRPVRSTANAANHIREGALDRRLSDDGDADLQPLVESFNTMVDALQSRIEREQRFASDVSHELRTPLAAMAAASSVARRRARGTEAAEPLDVLNGELEKFNSLIMDLLEISRVEAGVAELTATDVDPVHFAEEVLSSTHRVGVTVVADGSAGDMVTLDRRRVGQVLTNLLENADNYAGGATHLTVSGDQDHVSFTVDDAGPGIPAHERAYIFGRFARGAEVTSPGTGLGLALAAEHVRLHDGTIEVSEAPDGGARFVVTIPRHLS